MIKALLFDLNGTVIDICTSESDETVWRTTVNFLDYYGIRVTAEKFKEEYFEKMRLQKESRGEKFPEFDVVKLFAGLIEEHGLPPLPQLPETAALVFRAAGRYRLHPYEGATEVLEMLRKSYRMAAVSDGQKLWALPEMRSCGLDDFFSPMIISSDYGFRKPDPRLFQAALKKLRVRPDEVIFVGNDLYRDIYGAGQLGMKTVFFRSNQGDHEFNGIEPDYIIYNFRELPEAVRFLAG